MSEILRVLEELEKEHNIKVLFAVEAGSRSTGLESKNSDYDVRFVFVRPLLYRGRETLKDTVVKKSQNLDIAGWEAQKALQLASSLNGTLFEWLNSSVVHYVLNDGIIKLWRAQIISFFEKTESSVPLAKYYAGILKNERRAYLGGRKKVQLKEYLHALRPALLCESFCRGTVPCLSVPELLEKSVLLDEEGKDFIRDLIVRKRSGEAIGEGSHKNSVDHYFDEVEKMASALPKAGKTAEPIPSFAHVFHQSLNACVEVRVIHAGILLCSDQLDKYGRSYADLIETWLCKAGNILLDDWKQVFFRFSVFNAFEGMLPSEDQLASLDLLIISGSSSSSYDEDKWISKLIGFLKDRKEGRKCIGLCFGHQVLCQSGGGKVQKSEKGPEIGCRKFSFSETGKAFFQKDFAHLVLTHGDVATDLPCEASSLGSNEYGNQGFLIGKDVITLQGHPEFEAMHGKGSAEKRYKSGSISKEEYENAVKSLEELESDAVHLGKSILRNFFFT